MHPDDWFPVEEPGEGDDPDDFWTFDETDRAFLAALRAHAADWQVPDASTMATRTEDGSALLLLVTLSDDRRTRSLVLGEWGVAFRDGRVEAGQVCDQLFAHHQGPGGDHFTATGTTEDLARRCAAWFERLLARPVVRLGWPTRSDGYAPTRWEFADTGQVLVATHPAPPPGEPPLHRHLLRP